MNSFDVNGIFDPLSTRLAMTLLIFWSVIKILALGIYDCSFAMNNEKEELFQ